MPLEPKTARASAHSAAPVLPQPTRMIARFPIEARARQVLAGNRAPAQMNLFLRPGPNDPA